MSRTITALFDSRADAEAAKNRLEQASIDVSRVRIHDQSSAGYSATEYSTTNRRGFWAELKSAFLPDEDRRTYEEGVRRGGVLLTAEVDEHEADEAVRVLDDANSVDIEGRAADWRAGGWNDADYAAPMAATGTDYARGADYGRSDGEAIPIVEETLRVGKREVSRGGARVRSYVVETPVHEEVALREEHVSVERRPVDLPLSAADADAFRERTIEMTETAEEAVVAKQARVVEEVVVRKDVDTRVETIDDTVRRTEVEVDRLADNDRYAPDRMAAGARGGTLGDLDGDRTPGIDTRPLDPSRG